MAMKLSTDRILTTHVGSLPRPADVTEQVFKQEAGELGDQAAFDQCIARAVKAVVARQSEVGIDVVSDGEMSKISYATYIKYRLTGFGGDSPRRTPADLEAYPDYSARIAAAGEVPTLARPCCIGPIEAKDSEPLRKDLANFSAALAANNVTQGFMNAASPGVVAVFQPNNYYPSHAAYLEALAEAMKSEYEAIAGAGFVLQIDSPDVALGRHTQFKELSDSEFVKQVEANVEALNHALSKVPAENVRLHMCWGNYEGPHHCDIPLAAIYDLVMQAKPMGLLIEASNPRHEHEWIVFGERGLPDDKVLIPGVIDSVTNYIEHPELVAQRLCRFAEVVGRERVIAGADCGFATFAGMGAVDARIAVEKFKALVEGADIASKRLWGA